ncbi:hypothetical protein PHLGIDRAFT_113371 [Phlebiopsis gigantea 11061_1 CR5-6]|uniref:F-box domain-containing protein n=1 Tax=Phlebiopsis gigantea (strain 11061_1 CR5-6) TaxID=745531 RepID=A0A0C3PXE4_PHLG1|nr:hypothetical protein PHLGIDRAFT_113371 [Phlebiopsis gigantea 11061_1 CR5-6]
MPYFSAQARLPTELLLYIFECACDISHDTALYISLVSSWVRNVAKPHAFGTIVRRAGSLYPTQGRVVLSHSTPPPGCGQYVRHLWLENIDLLSSPREINLLKACPNIEDIAVSVNSLRTLLSLYANPHSTPSRPAIRSLTLINHTSRAVWLQEPPRALLDNITHLRMVDLQQSPYVPVEHLPNLTHLALTFISLRATESSRGLIRIPDNTAKCKHLKMVILTIDHYDWLHAPLLYRSRYPALAGDTLASSPRESFRAIAEAAKAKDSMIYVMLSPVMGNAGERVTVYAEWATAARGGEDIWHKAARWSRDESQLYLLPTRYPKRSL